MNPILRAVPNLCFAVGAIILIGQGYFLVKSMILGYGYIFNADLSRDMTIQLVATWMKVLANSLVWVAFGLLARLLIRAVDDLNSVRASLAANSREVSQNA